MIATIQKLYAAYDERTRLREKIIYSNVKAYSIVEKKIKSLENQLRIETSK